MKIKTNELTGDALDWAVATIHPQLEGLKFSVVDGVMCGIDPEDGAICIYMAEDVINRMRLRRKPWFSDAIAFNPSTDWGQGGPIIEREWIDLHCVNDSLWEAECPAPGGLAMQNGPTPLIAAMRCFVASKLGDEVDVPEQLCQPTA